MRFRQPLRPSSPTDFTGASNATFSLSLSLVTGNVGGNTKKMVSEAEIICGRGRDNSVARDVGEAPPTKADHQIASAVIFIGVGLGNIIGPYGELSRTCDKIPH